MALRNASGVFWIHGDHLGSASMTTDANGNKTSEYRYTPYGGVRVAWGSLPTNRKFTGYAREDAIGGIDYAQARYYDSVIGRFLSADTIVPNASNPQALNRYSYVFNRPTVMTDPSGHDPRDDFGHTMNDQCNYAGGCTNQVNPVVAHYVLSGGSPVAWNNLPAGHQAVFTGLGCYQRCYEADAGIRGSAENHTDEFAFELASLVAGIRVAGLLVKAGQVGLEWLGAKIVQVCASNPNCIALLIAAETGSVGPSAKIPPTPGGMGPVRFGKEIMQWGENSSDIPRQRISELTKEYLIENGVTVDIALAWADFYRNVVVTNSNNPSAPGRLDLMEAVVRILSE